MKHIKNIFFLFIILFLQSNFFGQTYTITIGSGSGTTTSPQGSPYTNNYDNARRQWVYTAAELAAAGAPLGGTISKIGFRSSNNGSNQSINLTIGVKNSTTSEWTNVDLNQSANWEAPASFTYIYNSSINTNAVSGWKYYGTSTFCWDGSSNIIVQVSNTGGVGGQTAPAAYYHSSKGSPCKFTDHYAFGTTSCCDGSGSGSTYVPPASQSYGNTRNRPDISFVITPSGGCPSSGSIPTSTTALCQVLPIELTSFDATESNGVLLTWTTASEKNNDYFIIERSSDGNLFEAMTKVKGSGNSFSEKKYNFFDNNPYIGINYYRLMQTDFDGTFKYSDIISTLYTSSKNAYVKNIYPNPTNDNFSIDTSSPIVDDVQVILIDNLGRIVYSNKKTIDIGVTSIEIETDDLPIGIYTCKILFNKSGENSIYKIIKN